MPATPTPRRVFEAENDRPGGAVLSVDCAVPYCPPFSGGSLSAVGSRGVKAHDEGPRRGVGPRLMLSMQLSQGSQARAGWRRDSWSPVSGGRPLLFGWCMWRAVRVR